MVSGRTQRRDEILRVCELSYLRGWTQQRIASHTGFSRWKVARLLAAGLEEGYVHIRIQDPFARDADLEAKLTRRYGLDEAVVVRERSTVELTIEAVSAQAARLLEQIRPNPEIVGISWGRTLAEVSAQLGESWAEHPQIVQLNGGVANMNKATSMHTVTTFARKAHGRAYIVPCPAIVGSQELAMALREDRTVKDVLEAGQCAQVALFSLGALRSDSVLVESGCLTQADVSRLRASGGVGDILGHFINGVGEIVDEGIEARTIGIHLSDLRAIPHSIAVAVGRQKGAITRAALLGSYAKILVTSASTARDVLADDEDAHL